MRIAGDTIRRNYLSRYETNYTDKYNSEKKIYSGRQFDRAHENPINAARALRLRKSQAEVETYQGNLKTADSIYTNAESSLLAVSGILQTVYEKLVEGAHGTRNQGDLDIIAMSIDNYAEEMVQSLNIDIADRKVFGGLNNDTVAFRILQTTTGEKYVTYNGVAVNTSNDPNSFPYSGESYLDIGIGMSTDEMTDRIDDQSALPITFNGVVCTGCGMTRKTASIDLALLTHENYAMDITVGGRTMTVGFKGDPNPKTAVDNINTALANAFREIPELNDDGTFSYIEEEKIYSYAPGGLVVKNNAIDMDTIQDDTYYSMTVALDGKKRSVDFLGSSDKNELLANMKAALDEQFGVGYALPLGDGSIVLNKDNSVSALITPQCTDVSKETPISGGKIDLAALEDDETYCFNLSGIRTDTKGNQVDVSGKVYFRKGTDDADTIRNINNAIYSSGYFGDSKTPYISETGTLVYDDKDVNIVISNASPTAAPMSDTNTVALSGMKSGRTYALNIRGEVSDGLGGTTNVSQNIYFKAGATPEATMKGINRAIANSGVFDNTSLPTIDENGLLSSGTGNTLELSNNLETIREFEYTDINGYANNIMQLVLDSAKLLREGNQDMVARYADLVYAAQANLSIAIADLGTNSKFIEFNEDRLADVMININSKQNDIESTDLPSEITHWKVLESIYNASLQMGSSVLSQTIFDYIH